MTSWVELSLTRLNQNINGKEMLCVSFKSIDLRPVSLYIRSSLCFGYFEQSFNVFIFVAKIFIHFAIVEYTKWEMLMRICDLCVPLFFLSRLYEYINVLVAFSGFGPVYFFH